ncbi:MAG: pyruvate, water dikinase regulatory protein [Finegoldia sp.]|nr:pyruvate, water dikinase regulatory protein [Finegoldia sp.]
MKEINILILSDSIGDTGERIAQAALAQFDIAKDDVDLNVIGNIRNIDQLSSALSLALDLENVLIYYSFVNESLIEHLESFCMQNNISHVDILTPAIKAIEELTNIKPYTNPGALRKLDEQYYKRIEAIEFAVRYDDGKDPAGILRADLVIIGISRTSKTPLSMYLANKGYKVCNIPLVPESPVPKELFEINPARIIGLTNSPEKLYSIRRERLKSMGVKSELSYSDLSRILEELDYAEKIMKKIGCPIINVSQAAIEETAEKIIRYQKKLSL